MQRRKRCGGIVVAVWVVLAVFLQAGWTGQASGETWGGLYHGPWTDWWTGTTVNDFVETGDGYVLVGTSNGYGVIFKIDLGGAVVWSHLFQGGGYQRDTQFSSLTPLAGGGYAVVGSANIDTPVGLGGWDVYVVWLDAFGGVVRERLYGRVQSAGQDHPTDEYGRRIYENDDDTLTVTGTIVQSHIGQDCPYHGYESGLVLNLDEDGDLISQHVLAGSYLGGPRNNVYAVSDGGYLVGLIHAFTNLGYTLNLQKYDPAGNLTWTRGYYAMDGQTPDLLNLGTPSVVEVSDGYLVSHSTAAGRLYLFKIDFTGAVVDWQKKYKIYGDAHNNSAAYPGQLVETADGGTILSITSGYSPVWDVLFKSDGDGNLEWANLYGSGRTLPLARPATGGGYLTAGAGFDVVFARLSDTGFLDDRCSALPISSQTILEEPVTDTTVIAGLGPITCNAAVLAGTWAGNPASLLDTGEYHQVDACVPDRVLDPTFHGFGDVKVGNASPPRTVSVSDYTGLGDLHIGQISLTDPVNFSLLNDGCSNQTLAGANFPPPPTSCTLAVVFNPQSKGLKTAHLIIPGNDPRGAGDITFTGTGTVDQYTLTVQVSPGGAGTVSPPGGGVYDEGTPVPISASAAQGYRFDRWEGGLTGNTNPTQIVMDGNKTVTAVFVQQFTLTVQVSPAGTGSVLPPGGTYDAGTPVPISAAAAPAYRFDHWDGGLTGNTNPTQVVMNGDKTVTAVFVLQTYTLTVSISPVGAGSVTLDPPGGTYLSGASVALTPQAGPGYRFDRWEGSLTGTANPGQVVMDGDKAVTAVFVPRFTLTVQVLPAGAGTVSPPGGGVYDAGTSVPLSANAASGYHFDHWQGGLTGNANPAQITMNGHRSVTAVFLPDAGGPVLFSVDPNPFGLGSTVTLVGSGFTATKGTVLLGSLKAKVTVWQDTSITFSLTKGLAGTYPVKVVLKKNGGESNTVDGVLSPPVIDHTSTDTGAVKSRFTVYGNYFGFKKSKVQFVSGNTGAIKNGKVVAYSNTELTVEVPKVAPGAYQIKVVNKAGVSEGVAFTIQ